MLFREWVRFKNRLIFSWAGWSDSWRSEPSLRFWTFLNAISAMLVLVFEFSNVERAFDSGAWNFDSGG